MQQHLLQRQMQMQQQAAQQQNFQPAPPYSQRPRGPQMGMNQNYQPVFSQEQYLQQGMKVNNQQQGGIQMQQGPNMSVMGPPTPNQQLIQQQLMQSVRSPPPIRSPQPTQSPRAVPSPRTQPSASPRAQPSPHHLPSHSPAPQVGNDMHNHMHPHQSPIPGGSVDSVVGGGLANDQLQMNAQDQLTKFVEQL